MKPRKPNISTTSTTRISTRVAHDHKGQAAVEFEPRVGSLQHDVDTLRLVALEHDGSLSLEDSGRHPAAVPFDPYNKDVLRTDNAKPRKSIDDLRKLSEEITKTKVYNPKRKGKR